MIQRIQTLFLALAALLLILLLLPFQGINWIWTNVSLSENSPSQEVEAVIVHLPNGNILEMVWIILALLLSVSAIFLYSNRGLQAKVVLAAAWLTMLGLITAAFSAWQTSPAILETVSLGPGMVAYLAACGMQYMAFRKIKKDEQLVRSMDRLR